MEKLLVEFARHADRRRFEPRFVSLSTRGVLADEIESLGGPVTALEEPPGLRPGLVLRLAGLFRRWKSDVVHAHNSRPLVRTTVAAEEELYTGGREGVTSWLYPHSANLPNVSSPLHSCVTAGRPLPGKSP